MLLFDQLLTNLMSFPVVSGYDDSGADVIARYPDGEIILKNRGDCLEYYNPAYLPAVETYLRELGRLRTKE